MRFFYDAHFVVSGWNGQYLGVDEINHHGSRGRKISFEQTKKPKVLLLGDSQVVASASKLEEMPESQLERILKTEFHALPSRQEAGGKINNFLT